MRLVFGIVSTLRKTNYLQSTLESLEKTGFFADPENLPLRVFIDSDMGYAEPSAAPGKIELVGLSQEEKGKYKFDLHSVRARACAWNHARALRCLVQQEADTIVVFEDDIIFAQGWLPRLRRILDDIMTSIRLPWVLSLFLPDSTDSLLAYQSGRLWIPYPRKERAHRFEFFWGMQGLVYPQNIVPNWAEYIFANCVDQWKGLPVDHSLVDFLVGIKGMLLATAPSLIQHVGTETAGGGGGGHVRTPSFVEVLS